MTTALYVRVSTDEQAKHGYSIAEQIHQCKLKAETTDIIEYVDDGVSGEFLDRPALSRLRQDVKDKLVDTVICYDPDRLSRNLMNALIVVEEFEKRAKLIFVNGEYKNNPEGKMFFQMRGAFAEFEKAKINERMSGGRRSKARQGKVVRDFQIYGYSYDKETAQFTINESEAAVVRQIFDLFTKPNDLVVGINGIAKYLTAQGIPTKKNKDVWHRQVVRQLLMNRAYIGEFYQNRWNTEGMLGNQFRSEDDKIPMTERPMEDWILNHCPVIIDADQWHYAQKLLEESRRRWAGNPKNDYFLSGLVRCGECGNTMTGRKAKNWGTYVYEYTCVKNTAGAKNNGCGHRIKCSELDEHVWNHIHQWLTVPAEVAATMTDEPVATEQLSFEEAEQQRITKELEKIAKGRKNLMKLLTDAEDDTDDLVDTVREQLRELKDKETQLLDLQSELEGIIAAQSSSQLTENLLQDAIEHYLQLNTDELTNDQKKELVRMIVREIRVYKDEQVDIFTF